MPNPTIVVAALDDKQLKDSISNLVGHMKRALNTMTKDTDDAVSRMQKSLEKLGSLKIDSGGSADGGSSRRAKKQQEETQATKETTQAHKELKMTLDQEASAMKRAMGVKKGIDYVRLTSDVDPNLTYLVNANRDVDKQLEEIIQKEQRLIEQKKQEATETQAIANAQQLINFSMSGESIWGANVHDMQRTSRSILSQQSGATSISAANAEYTELENTIAKLLNIQVQELNLTTNANGAYVALNASLGQMTNAYREMTKSERDSAQGQELADKIQKTSKAIQDIQKQMNRPISLKSILGFEPKTLDDLHWKIRQLQAYKGGIDFTKPGAEAEVVKVDNAINRLTRDLDKYMGTGKRAQELNLAIERSWSYMKNRLAFYFTVGASTAFIKNLIRVRSEYEMNERALGVLIDSAERGTQIFNELSQMALVSPYTLIELSSAAKQLVAYDIAAKDVVDTTRRLADISAAVGVPVERFTYALGQVKAFGHLTSQDARQFLNTGVPLVKELSKYYTELEGRLISTADVYERMKKHAVSYNDVVMVLNKMTDEGGKFFDYQAKTADTLKVQLANLTLAWNNMLNDIGKQTQGILSTGVWLLRKLFLQWKTLDSAIMNTFKGFAWAKGIQAFLLLVSGRLSTMDGWITLVGRKITIMGLAARKAFSALATNPFTWAVLGITALVSIFDHLNKVEEAAREMNREIASGAKEAFSSLDEYLTSEGAKSSRTAASRGQLGDEMAQKTWESIREEIELASIASDSFIAKLLEEEDINKRVTMAFDVADKIKEATSLLSGLNEEAFKVHQDSWLWGAFGEGLAEDIEDYIEAHNKIDFYGDKAEVEASAKKEAEGEMAKLAKDLGVVLRDRLGAEINDSVALGEAIERFRAKIKEKNPQIRGEVAQWFDVKLDELLANEFGKATLASTSINKQFLTILKRDYASAFSNISENILEDTATWGKAQEEAIKSAANELKRTTLPEFHDTIDQMLQYMNSKDWRIRIVTEMGITPDTAFQKEFDDRVQRELGLLKFEEYKYLRPTSEQDLYQWSTANLEALTKLQKERRAYETDNSTYSKNELQRIDDEIKARDRLRKLFNQPTSNSGSGGGSKKDPLGDALENEVQLIGEMQKRYKEYRKMGVNANTALTLATDEYGKSIARTNAVLNKFGIQTKTNNELAGMNLHKLRDYYQSLLAGASQRGNAKGIEAIEKAIANLNVEITKLDYKKITEGLNSELGKLKDEYELAVEFDASPELGNVFMSAMGLDEEELRKLPRTWNDVANKAQQAINRVFDENGFGKSFDLLANLDKGELEKWAKENGQDMDDALMKELVKFVEEVNKVRLYETKKTTKEWDDLIEKYGGLQHKLIKITKDSVQEQIKVIKQSNDADAIKSALNLSDKISMSQDPSEIARLQNELAVIFNKVITDNPDLFKVGIGVENQELSLISESYWEDFKNSELYSEVFDDMSRKSVQSIRVIIAALDALKDKVKDDPESMNALIKSLEDATKELESRNPLKTIGDGFKKIKEGIQTVKFNRPLLKNARKELDAANKSGDQERINKAQEDYNNALAKSRRGWDRIREGQEKVVAGLEGMKNQVSMIGDAFTSVANLFGEFGDEDTKQAIEDINKGFTIMVSTITAVIAVMLILQASSVWLLAVAAALGVIIGLVNFLSKRDNRRIDKQIEQSEYRVKQLENAYKNLQHEMDEAYGTAVIGAKQMAIANKKLQLEELKRQLQLEKSRSKKDYDKEKVLELEGQIIDLENEINDAINDIVENLLGVSSVGDAVGNLVDSIVDALRNGEDAMESFNESVDDMIVNMLKKFIMTRYIGPLVEEAFNKINDYINSKSQDSYDELELLKQERQKYVNLIKDAEKWRRNELFRDKADKVIADSKMQIANLDEKIAALNKLIQGSANLTESDLDVIFGIMEDLKVQASPYYDIIKEFLERYGMINDGNKELSALQQGIQSITEDTAGALEAITSGMYQQITLQSDILKQINTTLQSFDLDIQTATFSQILLQLQNSYQIHQSILMTMDGWTNAAGNAVKVELI